MTGKYRVITLCGSTRFKEQFFEAQKQLTLAGNIVISVGLFGHSGDDEVWTEGTKEMLDDMHKRKIDMADAIYVINVGGYIGSSTRSEIEYAHATGKEVMYLEEPGAAAELSEPDRPISAPSSSTSRPAGRTTTKPTNAAPSAKPSTAASSARTASTTSSKK